MADSFDRSSEQFVAERLFVARLLTKWDYESVLSELAQTPPPDAAYPRTALHVIQKLGFRNLVDMLAFLSKDAGMPLVPLSRFTPQEAPFSLLGPDYAAHRGALPFDSLGGELLVAVLNPYNTLLQTEVRQMTGRPCIFYLVAAQEFDATLDALNSK
jgi:hypothetical protein